MAWFGQIRARAGHSIYVPPVAPVNNPPPLTVALKDFLPATWLYDWRNAQANSSTSGQAVTGMSQILSLAPSNVPAGSGNFSLAVNGSGFKPTSVVYFGALALTTTFISATQITGAVPSTALVSVANVSVTVADGSTGVSSPAVFSVLSGAITVTNLYPSSQPAGNPQFTLYVVGTNFLTSSVVNWNGAALATTYIGATSLSAIVPAANIASATTASVTVVNGTTTSNTASFPVLAVYYQYSNGVFDFTNWPAVNDYSGGIIGGQGSPTGQGTEPYTDTTYVQLGHSYSFRMQDLPTSTYGLWQPGSNWGVAPYGFDASFATHRVVKINPGAVSGMIFNAYAEYAAESDVAAHTSVQDLRKLTGGSFPVNTWTYVKIPLSSLGCLTNQQHFYKTAIQFQVGGQQTCWIDDAGFLPGIRSLIENGTGAIVSGWVDASVNASINYNVVPAITGSGGTDLVSLAGRNTATGAPSGSFTSMAYALLTVTSTGGYWQANYPGGFQLGDYEYFTFGVSPTKSPYGYVVSLLNTSGGVIGSVTVGANSSYTLNDNGVSATAWTVYNFDKSVFGIPTGPYLIGGVRIQDNSGLSTNSIPISVVGFYR